MANTTITTKILLENDRDALADAVKVLKSGGVVIYPTETAYGMGADFTNNKAKERIYAIKNRSIGKKLSIIIGSVLMCHRYIRIDNKAKKLIGAFMPGPFTLVCDTKRAGNTGEDVAFRIPRHKFALNMVKRFGKPVTATSANISDKGPVYEIKKIIEEFDGKVDLIIDGGNLPKRKVSTIYDVRSGKILRKGPVTKKEIDRIFSG